jgi:mRNA-degrading endonuclease RelE of RelBE toxin-antitoxin system
MWKVVIHKKIAKVRQRLPKIVKYKLDLLIKELQIEGPYRTNWLNYGPLKDKKNLYHCHIKKGTPTYVVVWQLLDKEVKILEVTYVGTHEKAQY